MVVFGGSLQGHGGRAEREEERPTVITSNLFFSLTLVLEVGGFARAQEEPPGDPTRCQPITPLDSPLVLFFVAVSHGVIGEDSLMESSDI